MQCTLCLLSPRFWINQSFFLQKIKFFRHFKKISIWVWVIIWAETNLGSRHYASAVRAPHYNKISLGQGNDNTDVVFDTNTTERSSKDIQSTNVNLFECNLINFFNGSPSWNRQHYGQTIHPTESFISLILFKKKLYCNMSRIFFDLRGHEVC